MNGDLLTNLKKRTINHGQMFSHKKVEKKNDKQENNLFANLAIASDIASVVPTFNVFSYV